MNFGPPEHVYVENDWHDGPLTGVADVAGVPHRFARRWVEADDDYATDFLIWPISPEELLLEQERWRIFVAWHRRYDAREVDTSTHPGRGGIDARWDYLDTSLHNRYLPPPEGARRAALALVRFDRVERFADSGPDYALRWSINQQED
ncbi:hypothetical protein ACNI65_00900 [Roseateles sp. So40a]|uniref:hypothetical protein n=1 Tax=Roseateles sp. So40a TaxID=3400226 RepID=UPI003A846B8B